jgi:hypothetical protein
MCAMATINVRGHANIRTPILTPYNTFPVERDPFYSKMVTT